MHWRAATTHLSMRYVAVGISRQLEEIGKHGEMYVSRPGCFDPMAPRMEVVMESNLDEVPGEMGPAGHHNLFERQSPKHKTIMEVKGKMMQVRQNISETRGTDAHQAHA